jgi:hypothetical protein
MNSQHIKKPFDQAVYEACDPPARDAVIKVIEREWGLSAKPNENIYKVDLVIDGVGYAEVEMRDWDECPFDTIHVPERKAKLFQNDMKTIYFVVSKSLYKCWYIDAGMILKSPLLEVKNKAISQGEYFYDVPKYLFKTVKI